MSDNTPSGPAYPGDQGPGDHGTPPPPPPPGGWTPPPAQQPQGGSEYASWGLRLAAYLLDAIFVALVYLPFYVVGMVLLGGDMSTDPMTGELVSDQVNPIGVVLIIAALVLGVGFAIWNFGIKQGRTGQSLGKGIVDIKVLRETGETMGAGLGVGRYLLFAILTSCTCYLNVLWPLWDQRKQALHDKVVKTLVLKA